MNISGFHQGVRFCEIFIPDLASRGQHVAAASGAGREERKHRKKTGSAHRRTMRQPCPTAINRQHIILTSAECSLQFKEILMS